MDERRGPDDPLAPADAATALDSTARPEAGRSPDRPAEGDEGRELELELVARAAQGELEAFNRLVDRYQDYLYALAFRILSDRDQAADAVQEAFFHAFRHIRGYRGGSFRSWLTRIGVNACMDVLRAKRRHPSQPFPQLEDESWEPAAGPEQDPEARAAQHARARALTDALRRITPDQRTAIVLFDVEGYDYQEIAELTRVSLGTVKSRIHRGRLALRALLVDHVELFRG